MAERFCQNSITLLNGCKRSVTIENVLTNMLIVSLECGPKCYRGALFESDKENLCYGINLKRQQILDAVKQEEPKLVTVQPEAPKDDKKDVSISTLYGRFSYGLDTEAVDPSLANNTSRKPCSRPLINRSLNRMRLRARQVVCSLCKKGIHETKKGAAGSSVKNSKPSNEDKRPSSVVNENKRSSSNDHSKSVINSRLKALYERSREKSRYAGHPVQPSSGGNSKSNTFSAISDTKKRKHLPDTGTNRSEQAVKKQKLGKISSKANSADSIQSPVRKAKSHMKSSPAIKISFASPKGVGTVLKIPPRPSTPNPTDSDLSQDNAESAQESATESPKIESDKQFLKPKKISVKLSTIKPTTKRSKHHSKHKSKKKSKWAPLKSPVHKSFAGASPLQSSVPSYRFVPRSENSGGSPANLEPPTDTMSSKAPAQNSQLSPDSMKCKVVIEKLDENKISPRSYQDPTNFSIVNNKQGTTAQGKGGATPIGKSSDLDPAKSQTCDNALVPANSQSRQPNTDTNSNDDYRQYFEDISDSDSNPLQVDLGDDDDEDNKSAVPGINPDSNDENAEPRPLKIHIQNRQVAKCKLDDGRILRIGDVIWGKIVGFPWWPGRITSMLESSRDSCSVNQKGGVAIARTAHVNWFGSSTMSVMNCADLYPFLEYYKDKFTKKKKGSYKRAIKQANLIAQSLGTSFKATDSAANTPTHGGSEGGSNKSTPVHHSAAAAALRTAGYKSSLKFSDISSCDSQSSAAPSENKNVTIPPVENNSNVDDSEIVKVDITANNSPKAECYSDTVNNIQNKADEKEVSHKNPPPIIQNIRRKSLSSELAFPRNESQMFSTPSNVNSDDPLGLNDLPPMDSEENPAHKQAILRNQSTGFQPYNTQNSSEILAPTLQDMDIQKVPFSDPVLTITAEDSNSQKGFDESMKIDDVFDEKLMAEGVDDFRDQRVFEAISDLEEGEIIDSSAEEA